MGKYGILQFGIFAALTGVPCTVFGGHPALATYAESAFRGLEAMRGPQGAVSNILVFENGKPVIADDSFGPTELGLDLLVQLSARTDPHLAQSANANLERIIGMLRSLPKHGSGLFYRVYRAGAKVAASVVDHDLSSIDNLHLALGLWSVSQAQLQLSQQANALFSKMDFSGFWDPKDRLLGGNLKHAEGSWVLEPYRYHLGSEARSLYFLGVALGLFGGHGTPTGQSVLSAIKDAPLELATLGSEKVFRVWDGGLFQLFLPSLLIGEKNYSGFFAKQHHAVWNHLKNVSSSGVPLFSSATLVKAEHDSRGQLTVSYSGKAGHPEIKSTLNRDVVDSMLFVPHAVLLVGLEDSEESVAMLAKVQKHFEGHKTPAYLSGFGWVSSVSPVGGPAGGVVGVDKAIEALASFAHLSPDKLSISAKLLQREGEVSARLMEAYQSLLERISPTE